MRILITGGTGFIGTALGTVLLNAGHSLTILSRKPQTVRVGAEAWASLDQWTPDRAFDAVINFAGEPIIGPRWTDQRKSFGTAGSL
jgi:NAD dependent epimerase/dehydratase family enzyme